MGRGHQICCRPECDLRLLLGQDSTSPPATHPQAQVEGEGMTNNADSAGEATQAELLRLQERVLELETELGQRSWKSGDFYRLPTISGAPTVLGQVVTLAENGKPFQVIEAAEPDLMTSIPTIRTLRDGLAPNVVESGKPEWWPL